MLDFISSLSDIIGTCIQAILDTVSGFLKFIQLIPIGRNFLAEIVSSMPIEISSFLLFGILASIVLLILGR